MSKYFTANNLDSLVFYQVPKVLLIGDKYKTMNPNAMKLYIILIDRIKLSMMNNWKDELGRYYVRLSIEKGSELLGFSDSTFKRAKKELAKYELLEEKREGMNKSNILYPLMLEYTEEDIYRLNNEVDDLLIKAEETAKNIDKNWMGQNELSSNERIGQNELSGKVQIEPSRKVNLNHPDGSKRTTNNNNSIKNNFNNNENNLVNNLLTREETIHNLISEYMKKGLPKEVCIMVLDEVEKTPDVKNFGAYFRTCLDNALHKRNLKYGNIDFKEKKINGQVPFYNWLDN
ncbi:replication initiator protein A [Bacillus subtilis]|uniref:replication initiator protein A n=1 Tax=Bacillus subtilis TaxID=1423 RepID=UPI001D60E889|nr:replication initiator protein A [Alkalicoccobacillus gibsonii]